MSKNNKKYYSIRLAFLLIIIISLGVSMLFQAEIEKNLGLGGEESTEESLQGESDDDMASNSLDENITLSGNGGELAVHFIDVGQGDSTIVELPDGKNMIIDAGDTSEDETVLYYIEENLVNNKEEDEKLTTFDYVILTHSDADHCGGLDSVFETYGADVFYRPNELATNSGYEDPGEDDLLDGYTEKSTVAYKKAIDTGYANSQTVIVSNALDDTTDTIEPEGIEEGEEGYYKIVFYAPIGNSYSDVNNYSPIIIIEYEGKRIALSGDAEAESEKEFIEMIQDSTHMDKYDIFDDNYTVDIIKLGHHGSRTSSSEDYLEALSTESSREDILLIISCGEGNSYEHPHEEVLERVSTMGFGESNILRTDTMGDIVCEIRFDEESQSYKLYQGLSSVEIDKTQSATTNSDDVFELRWYMIALAIGIFAFAVLILVPVFGKTTVKKAYKKYTK